MNGVMVLPRLAEVPRDELLNVEPLTRCIDNVIVREQFTNVVTD